MLIVSRRMIVKSGALALVAGAGAVLPARAAVRNPLRVGVNFAGAEFEKIGGHWRWPNMGNLHYYLDKGFNVFRVPFRWDRLQPELGQPLDATAMAGLDAIVAAATATGAVVILDAHDYGRRGGQIIAQAGSSVSAADFADFWGRLAAHYKRNPLVWYNLMNEPHDMDATANLTAQNAACAAIRAAGARAKVLFAGNAWTGAHSWVQSGNAQVMLGAKDPANNYAFDVHQYLDKGFGGSGPTVPGVAAHILDGVTGWARQHGKKLFLGEFGGDWSPASVHELDILLAYVVANKDVFLGATYFAGGGGWGHNVGSTDPIDGVEKPQTRLLERYLSR